jgi:DNA polymerase type B, organellar and viral
MQLFFLNLLSSFENTNLDILKKDDKLLDLKLSFDKYHINFRDSLLMLPVKLSDLAKAFQVENKSIFPYYFPNENNLNYIGNVPDFKYFSNISKEEYNLYLDSFRIDPMKNEQ